MSLQRQKAVRANSSFTPVPSRLLQRKCACGGTPGPAGECEDCRKKKRLGLQTKLKVNEPGDTYEQEADRIADQVLAMPSHSSARGNPPRIQRYSGELIGQTDAVPATVDQALASTGKPLEPALRQDMEQRFGYDFSQVQVHSDAAAEQSTHDVNAIAYTVGHSIVFGAGRFAPASYEGQRLLVHELAHVVQQNASAPLRGAVIQRDAKKKDPKLDALKAELVATFGLSAVTDTADAQWTIPQLEKMKRGLARIPAAERAAIKGVELTRVKTTSGPAGSSAFFIQKIAPQTGIRQDRLEIANEAFEHGEGEGETLFMGQKVQGEPSEGIILHEVGHAVESVEHRQAEEARVKSGISATAATATLGQAENAYNNAILTSLHVPGSTNAKEKNYAKAIIGAQTKLVAITEIMKNIRQTPTAAESKKGAAALKSALNRAQTAIALRNKTRTALPTGSTFAMPTEETAQDAWMAAAVAMLSQFEARAKAQNEAEKARHAEEATQITVRVSSGNRVTMNRRLAEFVAVIEVNKVDIAKSGLGEHVTSHWPNNPEEAYAELYSLSITAPEGLRKFDKKGAVAAYFTSPVGLKGAQKTQAASWLASHR